MKKGAKIRYRTNWKRKCAELEKDLAMLHIDIADLRAANHSLSHAAKLAKAQEDEWRTAFDCERSARKHADKIAQAAEMKFAALVSATHVNPVEKTP